MARPTKLDAALQERICVLIRAGNTIEVAAEAAGISESTFYGWLERGKKTGTANRPYRQFGEAVEQARAEAESLFVARIANAAQKGSWQAAAWLLERRAPERWAKASERKHLGNEDDHEAPADAFADLDAEAPVDLASARRRKRKAG